MRPLRLLGSALATALVLATGLALPASAVTLTITTQTTSVFGSNGNSNVTLHGPMLPWRGQGASAGGFALQGDLHGTGVENFTAWCLDIATRLRLPSTYTTTDTPFAPGLIGATTLANIERLFETGFATLNMSSNSQSAGFQLALWELLYETSGSFSLSAGNFNASHSNSAIARANALLAGMTGPVTQAYDLTFLQSDDTRTQGGHYSQHLVTVSAVPLPAGGVLLLGALGWLAALRRRTKPAAKPAV